MARTYIETDLALNDPSSRLWALAYVRFALRDKPNDADTYPAGSLTNIEIRAALDADARVDPVADGGDGTAYYVPHKTAARLLRADPSYLERFAVTGYSEERRKATNLARAIIGNGKWIDDLIDSTTSGRIGGASLRIAL